MKHVPEFLPQCSYISKELTLHIFTNREKNNACVFHSFKMSGRKVLTDNDGKFVVNGVPFAPDSMEANALLNALACGCSIDESCLDFIFFKLAEATSYNPQLDTVENLRHDPLNPRHRTFLAQAFARVTGLTVDDMFVGAEVELGQEFGGALYTLTLLARILGNNQSLPAELQLQLSPVITE